jgi:iron complex outermembrane receptor protein
VVNALGLLESEYLDFKNKLELPDPSNPTRSITVTADYSGNRLLNSPKLAWSGSIEASWPLRKFGWLVPRFDWSYKSEVFYDPNLGSGNLGEFPKGTLGQDGLWLLNARVAYRTPDQRIELAGWVRNLTNEAYVVDAFDVSLSFSSLLYVIGTPRFYGVSISYQF